MPDAVDARLDAYRRATSLAAAVAGIVLLFGTVVAVAPFVTHPGRVVAADAAYTDRTSTATDVVSGGAAPVRTRTVVTSVHPRPWQDALAATGGGVVIRLGLALAAALLAGGVTQRILVGHYAVKLGPVELDPVPVPAVAGAIRDVLGG